MSTTALSTYNNNKQNELNTIAQFIGFWPIMDVYYITMHFRKFAINILTKFHKDWMKTVTSTINILTKFHKDWMKTVTSTINSLTKFHEDWMKTATSIINILTKFHKDWMKTVPSTVYTNKLLTDTHTHTTDAGHHTVT
ncbi:hypothetical protein DPMN_037423 [Dreissena polymorpha]|uniref:Uncharacterized protein n=1 Tax=Dreissena polymorpha TaxID=45954 RepID=A0A9D4MFB9_DREPO|nr:hypothetical protein DPMN_037423 [Dreissena polymorpha]